MASCAVCGLPLAERGTGRPRRWCSETCRKRDCRAKTAATAHVFPTGWHRDRYREDRRELHGVRRRLAEILPTVEELRQAERAIVAELRRLA